MKPLSSSFTTVWEPMYLWGRRAANTAQCTSARLGTSLHISAHRSAGQRRAAQGSAGQRRAAEVNSGRRRAGLGGAGRRAASTGRIVIIGVGNEAMALQSELEKNRKQQ